MLKPDLVTEKSVQNVSVMVYPYETTENRKNVDLKILIHNYV